MKKKYIPNYIKVFSCNLELFSVSLESRFKNNIIRFDYFDFDKYFGLSYGGSNMSNSKEFDYDKILFVLSISKYVYEHM